MTVELTKSVETALQAFNEYKGMVVGFKTKLDTIAPKMDAFDEAKFDKLQQDIGKGIEDSQKQAARVKALEDQKAASEAKQAELEKDLSELKTAFNRVPAASTEEKGKEANAQVTKLFNQFARTDSSRLQNFSEYLKDSNLPEEVKALSVGSDPDGGYLTQATLGGMIQTLIYETSPMRQLASVTSISGDTLEYVLDNGQADAEWVSEASSGSTETTPKLGKESIPVHELAAKPKVTQKLLDDAGINVESWLGEKVSAIMSRKENTGHISGNGVGKPRGILSYAAGTDIALGQVEQIASGNASAIERGGLIRLQNSLKEDYQSNAVWLIKRSTNYDLLSILDGIGRPIFDLTFDKNAGMRPMIMGNPVYFANDMPTVQAAALPIAYGDFKRAYQIVDRIGLRVLRDPYTAKPFVMFYTTKRTGGAVINHEAYKLLKIAAS